MVTREAQHTISVVTDYSVEDMVVRGHFIWPEQQPKDVYTVDLNGVLSIALDKHFPIRPLKLVWEDGHGIGTETILERCFGDEVTSAMLDSRIRQGSAVVSMSFDDEQRLAIAEMQIHSPSTPPLLKRSLYAMFDRLRKSA